MGELAAVIEASYPKPDGTGHPSVRVKRMLRIHFLQHGFKLSDPAVEEAALMHAVHYELQH